MGQQDVSPSDEQLYADFVKFLQDHPEMLQGSTTPIPILFFVLAASFTLLVRGFISECLSWLTISRLYQMYDYLITFDEEVRSIPLVLEAALGAEW